MLIICFLYILIFLFTHPHLINALILLITEQIIVLFQSELFLNIFLFLSTLIKLFHINFNDIDRDIPIF